MRYIAILRASEVAGFPPPAFVEGVGTLGVEATKAGVLVDTAGLLPVATATRVGIADGEMTVTDGQLDGPSRPVAAYAIYDAATQDEVLEWTKRFMDLYRQTWPGWEGESEIRQLLGPESPSPA